jgi:integrase
MAYIRKKIKANGDISFECAITIKKEGVILHRESKTFSKQKLARDWGIRRELELQETEIYKKRPFLPVGDVIDKYIKEFDPKGRTKSFDLNKLLKRDIAKLDVHRLTAKDLIAHVRQRNEECLPVTAGNDLIWLNTVLSTMKGVIDLDTDLTIFQSARDVLRREGLIAKSTQRDRRPTPDEIWKLSRHFSNHYMLHIIWFAIYSARRQSEITRLRWDDLVEEDKTCIVRDLKNPRIKNLNKRFKLPRSAFKTIMKQPRHGDFIFPHNSKTVGKYFTDACKLLDIQDLHFHDLRHHATSILFEKGLSIVQVQQVTLHSTWSTLQRYCNLNPADIDI